MRSKKDHYVVLSRTCAHLIYVYVDESDNFYIVKDPCLNGYLAVPIEEFVCERRRTDEKTAL